MGLREFVKLKVSVHSAPKTLVSTTFLWLKTSWANQSTRGQLLEKILRENGHGSLAHVLDYCQVIFKRYRTSGVQNELANIRSRVAEEMIATTSYKVLLSDALIEIEHDELLFNVTTPAPTRSALVVDATS